MTEIHRVETDQDLIDALPLIMGFMPTDSLVMVCVNGVRFGMSARIDLGDFDMLKAGVKACLAQNPDSITLLAVGEAEATAKALKQAQALFGPLVYKTVSAENPEVPSAVAMDYAAKHDRSDALRTRDQIEADWSFIGGDIPVMGEAERDELFAIMLKADKIEPSMWQSMARRTVEPSANVYMLAALAHFLCGDGANAGIGVQHAEKIEPNHTLARLIRAVLTSGISPEKFREGMKTD